MMLNFGFIPASLRLSTAASTDPRSLRIEVHGYLDYDNADHFLTVVTEQIGAHVGRLRTLQLDCGALDGLDSLGLASLLMLHRRTTGAHITLRLDNRPAALERMLEITGTLDHLVPKPAPPGEEHEEQQQMAYRHTSEDGTT
ncbi:STAS domain-containing protein [Streptomyces sp. NPDC005529]|uniref:STAS domain-containing protein n=1 Tax=unclassified Streptomyces TaxID=2593676 RepID=UPI0033AC796D